MKHRLPILIGLAFALVVYAAADARAAFIPWSYNWTPGGAFLSATTGTGRLYMSDEPLGHALGTTDVVVTNLRTASTAPRDHADVFTNVPFSASVTILDGLNGLHGTLSFSGLFNGKISTGSSDLEFKLTSPAKETLVLGKDIYNITFGRYSPPGPPSASNSGSIAAHISVKEAQTQQAPEPSTALLACLGGSFLGLASWRRWARGMRAAQAPA
jgi:hypothetical protein